MAFKQFLIILAVCGISKKWFFNSSDEAAFIIVMLQPRKPTLTVK